MHRFKPYIEAARAAKFDCSYAKYSDFIKPIYF